MWRICKLNERGVWNEHDGETKFLPRITYKAKKEGIFINQTKYVRDILKKFGTSKKSASTPMSITCKLDKDEKDKKVDQKLYRGIIGSLLYLTASRLDIMLSICMCARFQSEPKKSYLAATKRILKYLTSTQNVGIWYSKGTSLDLVA